MSSGSREGHVKIKEGELPAPRVETKTCLERHKIAWRSFLPAEKGELSQALGSTCGW